MRILYALAVAVTAVASSPAEDWPQWLGPRRDGSSTEKIAAWKAAPKVLWRLDVGEGHSSPVVAGGKVYLHTKVKDKDEEQIAAYEAESGKPVWSKTYARAKFTSIFGVGPRATPLVHDGKVFTYGVTGHLACWDAATGKEIWSLDTAAEFKAPSLRFGVSATPVIEDGKLLVMIGAKAASIVAFDAKSGKIAWKSLDDPASYSSPVVIGPADQRQALFLTQKGVRSLRPADGKEQWFVPLVDLLNESSTTPVLAKDILIASSVTFGSLGVQLKNGNEPSAAQLWKNPTLTCYFSTPIVVGDHTYMVNGSIFPPPSSTLRCIVTKTGKEVWKKANVAKYHAALLRTADDKLLMLDDFGNIKLLDANSTEYKELATAKVCKPTWAHPALSEGRLYLRDDQELMCVVLRAAKK